MPPESPILGFAHVLRDRRGARMDRYAATRRLRRLADPRTTMHYDRARNNLDRHQNYILAAYMASGTRPGHGRHPDLSARTCMSVYLSAA